MNNDPIPFDTVREEFRKGELSEKSNEYLDRCSRGLANQAIKNSYIRHHATIIAEAIRHILLTRLLEEQEQRSAKQEKQNKFITKWFLILAIVTLISSFVQIGISLWSSLRSESQSQASILEQPVIEGVSSTSTNQP